MRRILAIFRKDARHLWPQAAVLAFLMGVSALLDPTYRGGALVYYDLLPSFALPLSCWLIVISVIHQEKLPGDRQYWLTRPYSRKELLAAKLLFLAVFINLPLLVYHAGVYAALGIPPASHLQELLWKQVFFTAFYVLPAAALASITRSVGRVLTISLLSAAGVWILGTALSLFTRHPLQVSARDANGTILQAALIIAGASAILALAYATRRTPAAGAIAAATALAFLALPAFRTAFAQPPAIAGKAPARLLLDTAPGRHSTSAPGGDPDTVTFDIPVRLEGAASGMAMDRRYFSLRTMDSRRRHGVIPAGLHDIQGGSAWLSLSALRYSLWSLEQEPVELSGSFELQLFDSPSVLPLPRQSIVAVPGIGACRDTREAQGSISFTCYSASPHAALIAGAPESRVNWIVTAASVEGHVAIESGFQPVRRFTSLLSYGGWDQTRGLSLVAVRPLPPFQVAVQLPPILLLKYQVPDRRP